MELCILSIGKISSSWIKEGIDLFESRIGKYIKCNSIIIPDVKNAKSLTKENLKEEEGKVLLSSLTNSDFVVLMDEHGKDLTSRELAVWIQKQMNSGKKRLVFVIGGPYGLAQDVYDKSNAMIALSKMTFTHEMAKLILTEQLYRSFTILKGEPYHHD